MLLDVIPVMGAYLACVVHVMSSFHDRQVMISSMRPSQLPENCPSCRHAAVRTAILRSIGGLIRVYHRRSDEYAASLAPSYKTIARKFARQSLRTRVMAQPRDILIVVRIYMQHATTARSCYNSVVCDSHEREQQRQRERQRERQRQRERE